MPTSPPSQSGPVETDAVIVGAGPCGIFQVFELGLLGIKAHVIDSLPEVGGQCTELYPDKPIYDIPAIPVCTAQELIQRLMEQIEPFHAEFHLGEEVLEVTPLGDGTFNVVTSGDSHFHTKTVFVAGGVGSFQPRKLKAAGAEQLEDKNVHYRVRNPQLFDGQRVIVLGGGDSALDWALDLVDRAAELTLVHRRPEFRAVPASVEKMRALCDQGRMSCQTGAVESLSLDNDQLAGVVLKDADGDTQQLPADHLLVFYGLAPKLGPIAEWGLDINRKTINVDTETFQTNVAGVYAIGDINHYPGKKKLILSGFHEAALAAFAAKAHIDPGRKVHLQYTTTSPLMHERLGVGDDAD
jgi:thioredoxin reductase (NADPH)